MRRYLLLLSFLAIYSDAQNSEPSIIMGQEVIDNLELSCCWRGQKSASSERLIIFLRTDIILIMFKIVVLLSFICPVGKYSIPTPISPLSTASCTYFQQTALVQKRWPLPHMKAISATTAAAGVVAGIAAAAVGCRSCCCLQTQTQYQQQHTSNSGAYGIAADNNLQYNTPIILREQDAYCTRIIASILRAGGNRDTASMSSIEHLIPDIDRQQNNRKALLAWAVLSV